MRKILAIGGAVVKTTHEQLKEIILKDEIEMLIHNGGSIFHDFQRTTQFLKDHSYPLDDLLDDYECNRKSSVHVWNWIKDGIAPKESATELCVRNNIPVLLFTVLGADFWHLFSNEWDTFGSFTKNCFDKLCSRFFVDDFHFVNMGSSVVHPEVFIKAIAVSKPKKFKADVVDFKARYRPRTRVARYGKYYKVTHKEFFDLWLKGEI